MFRDGAFLLQQEVELVFAVEEAEARERIDGKGDLFAVWESQRLRFQIDGHLYSGLGEESSMRFLIHYHGQESVLERVAPENICESGTHYGTKSVVQQGPWGVLAGRTATEVVPSHQHFTLSSVFLVENEVGPSISFLVVPPIGKEPLAEPVARGDGQESRRNNLIRIDVRVR